MQEQIYQAIDYLNGVNTPNRNECHHQRSASNQREEDDLDALFILGDALISRGLHNYAEKVYVTFIIRLNTMMKYLPTSLI